MFARRERPHVIFGDPQQPATPTHLTSGVVYGSGDACFTLIQPIATKPAPEAAGSASQRAGAKSSRREKPRSQFPFTGVAVAADGVSASVTRRQLKFGSGPLPVSILADGHELLSAPAAVAAPGCAWSAAALAAPGSGVSAAWASRCVAPDGSTAINATTTLHEDGWMTCDLTVASQRAGRVALTLPMRPKQLFSHSMVGWNSDWNFRFNNRNDPAVQWWADAVGPAGLNLSFTPQLWLGDGEGRGIAWLCDGPSNWTLPAGQKERAAMVVSETADSTLLTVTMTEDGADDLSDAGAARTLRFGLMPTPVRPLPTRSDLQNPKISPAMGWFGPDGVLNPELFNVGALVDPGPLSALSGDVSMAVWVRVDDSARDLGATSKQLHVVGSQYFSIDLDLSSRNVSVTLLDEAGQRHYASAVVGGLAPGKWLHLACSHTHSTQTHIFVDGEPVYSGGTSFTFQSGPAPFTVGGGWHGAIADLRVLSHGMSSAEAKALCQTGTVSSRAAAATVAHFSFRLSDAAHNGSYASSLWPSLPSPAGPLAIVLNEEVKKVKPAAFSKGTAVAGPGRGEHSAWALRLDGKMVQATSNVRNVTLLEYVKNDQAFDFVILWEAWSDVWGFPGFGAAGDPYKTSLRKLLFEAHKIGLKILPYIDVSMLSSRAPDFEQIFPIVHRPEGGKDHPGNFSNQPIHKVATSSAAWSEYWNGHLQRFVNEFDVDGFYCDESDLQTGINDANGRANFDLGGARELFAKMYEIVNSKGMVLIQDNSAPAVPAINYRTDILLTG